MFKNTAHLLGFMKQFGTYMHSWNKTQEQIFDQISAISQKPWFYLVYIWLILASQYFTSIENLKSSHPNKRYSINELAIITGIILKNPISFSWLWMNEKSTLSTIEELWTLFQELHWLIFSQSIFQEALFYADSWSFDFQYLDFFEKRYSNDYDWILQHKGFNLDDAKIICETILNIHRFRWNDFIEGKSAKELSIKLFHNLCFSRYEIYEKLPGINTDVIDFFLKTFSCIPGSVNADFMNIGSRNQIYSNPIIQMENDIFFIPIKFLLRQAMYTQPIEWMRLEDPEYFRIHWSKNRWDTSENIVYELLKPVIWEWKIFQNIDIYFGKQRVTDADILCFIWDKAVIVQVKSKILTLEARWGNLTKIEDDYTKAIQDAFNQGIKVKDALLWENFTFKNNSDNTSFTPPIKIDEAFVLCVTSEAFPASAFLGKLLCLDSTIEKDIIPMAISLFDLHLITFYLKDPYEFLFYLKQRYLFNDHIFAQSEIALLWKHLKEGLYTNEWEFHLIDEMYQMDITAHFLQQNWRLNFKNQKVEPPFYDWKNNHFNELLSKIKSSTNENMTDAILFLYSLSWDSRNKIFEIIDILRLDLKKYSKKSYKSSFLPINDQTIWIMCARDISKEINTMKTIAQIRKYWFKSNKILFFWVPYNISDPWIVYFDKTPWVENQTMREEYERYTNNTSSSFFDAQPRIDKRIWRNDRCPCNSWKKFKKCHWL